MSPSDNNPPFNSVPGSEDPSGLGKGLESLIPKKSPNDAQASRPASAPSGQTSSQPQTDSRGEEAEWRREALLKEREKIEAAKLPDAIFHIEVEKISPNPDQPRRTFEENSLRELAASIREFGLLQPIVVSKIEREVPTGTEVEYELISGERRLQAVKLLRLPTIPAIIRNVRFDRERLELAVIENIQREDLNPIEMGRALARLQDEFRLTQREIAVRLGKSREAVANTMRLLDLPIEIQKALEETKISESHGRLLLTVDDPALQLKLFRDLLDNAMTTRELRNRARSIRPREISVRAATSPELKAWAEQLSSELGTPVLINQQGETGKITISFYSEEELRHLIQKLGGQEES